MCILSLPFGTTLLPGTLGSAHFYRAFSLQPPAISRQTR